MIRKGDHAVVCHLLVGKGAAIRSACSRRIPTFAVPAEKWASERQKCARCDAAYERSKASAAPRCYVWALRPGSSEPMEAPLGPFLLAEAESLARDSARQGDHDHVVSRGIDPESSSFSIERRYRAVSGQRLT